MKTFKIDGYTFNKEYRTEHFHVMVLYEEGRPSTGPIDVIVTPNK